MKKLAAITLLLIHLFNLAGYPFLFRYLAVRSGVQAVANIEKSNYDDADLIEIKVPLNLPYVSNWSEYERYDGTITIEGVHHNYVKRKISADTLYLLCLSDKEANKLLIAKSKYGQKVNDFGATGKENDSSVKKGNLLNYFCQQENIVSFEGPQLLTDTQIISHISPLHKLFIAKDDRPPQINS